MNRIRFLLYIIAFWSFAWVLFHLFLNHSETNFDLKRVFLESRFYGGGFLRTDYISTSLPEERMTRKEVPSLSPTEWTKTKTITQSPSETLPKIHETYVNNNPLIETRKKNNKLPRKENNNKVKFSSHFNTLFNETQVDEMIAKYEVSPFEVKTEFDVPFAKLRVCDGKVSMYSCDNDPTCSGPDCVHNNAQVKLNDYDNWIRYYEQRDERLALLKSILERMQQEKGPNPDRKILVMAFNTGFSHLFANWYCSALVNNVDLEELKTYVLLMPTDEEARNFAVQLGFFAPSFKEIVSLTKWTKKVVAKHAAGSFGQGAHKDVNLILKFSMPLDMVSLGYTFMSQDVDIIWTQNAYDIIYNQYCTLEQNCDAVFIEEKRPYVFWRQLDIARPWLRNTSFPYPGYPEANTGMFMLRPSEKMIAFLKLILKASRLQQWRHTDQTVWNTILYHRLSPKLNFFMLPVRRFVPGKWTRKDHYKDSNTTLPVVPEIVALHASDTSSFVTKFHRFRANQHWYFNETICPVPWNLCKSIHSCWESVEILIKNYCTDDYCG